MSAFADGEWDSCDNIFLNEDADFMLDQLFSNEVREGSSSSSVAPAIWSLLENDSNLTEASQSFFHPGTNSNHLSTHYGFSGHTEVGVFPEQLSNSNVLSEYYMTGDIASPAPFFWNAAPEAGTFIAGLEMSRVEPDILISIPNTPLSLKRKLDVTMYGQHNTMTSEIPNKKTRMKKNVRPPQLPLQECTCHYLVLIFFSKKFSECRIAETKRRPSQRRIGNRLGISVISKL